MVKCFTMSTKTPYKFVYHTIAIEGNTLTYKEVIDVIQTGKAPGGADVAELSEIVGMEAAIKLVNRTIPYPITEDHIMNLHRRILGPVDPDNAGQYRKGYSTSRLACPSK